MPRKLETFGAAVTVATIFGSVAVGATHEAGQPDVAALIEQMHDGDGPGPSSAPVGHTGPVTFATATLTTYSDSFEVDNA